MTDWISVEEAAKISGYHRERIRELARDGKISAQKFATVWQIERSSLLSYMQNIKKVEEEKITYIS